MSIQEIKKELARVRAEHHDNVDVLPSSKLREMTLKIKELQKMLSDEIASGAKPCPSCGRAPIGIEHQTDRQPTYEVGCVVCPPAEHKGVMRKFASRGGILPRHAVEAWNEGPDFWVEVK